MKIYRVSTKIFLMIGATAFCPRQLPAGESTLKYGVIQAEALRFREHATYIAYTPRCEARPIGMIATLSSSEKRIRIALLTYSEKSGSQTCLKLRAKRWFRAVPLLAQKLSGYEISAMPVARVNGLSQMRAPELVVRKSAPAVGWSVIDRNECLPQSVSALAFINASKKDNVFQVSTLQINAPRTMMVRPTAPVASSCRAGVAVKDLNFLNPSETVKLTRWQNPSAQHPYQLRPVPVVQHRAVSLRPHTGKPDQNHGRGTELSFDVSCNERPVAYGLKGGKELAVIVARFGGWTCDSTDQKPRRTQILIPNVEFKEIKLWQTSRFENNHFQFSSAAAAQLQGGSLNLTYYSSPETLDDDWVVMRNDDSRVAIGVLRATTSLRSSPQHCSRGCKLSPNVVSLSKERFDFLDGRPEIYPLRFLGDLSD